MRRRPLETGAFNPAPDPSSLAYDVVWELCIYVPSAYTIGHRSSLYAVIACRYLTMSDWILSFHDKLSVIRSLLPPTIQNVPKLMHDYL